MIRVVINPGVFTSALIGSRGGAPDLVMRAFVDDRTAGRARLLARPGSAVRCGCWTSVIFAADRRWRMGDPAIADASAPSTPPVHRIGKMPIRTPSRVLPRDSNAGAPRLQRGAQGDQVLMPSTEDLEAVRRDRRDAGRLTPVEPAPPDGVAPAFFVA